MIEIISLESCTSSGESRLSARIKIDESEYTLWLSVDEKYSEALCTDRADGFLIALLPLAIRHRHTIISRVPITDVLLDGVRHDFLEVIYQKEPKIGLISIHSNTLPPIVHDKTVLATGLSCGADCLYTVRNRMLSKTVEGDRYFFLTNTHPRSEDQTDELGKFRFDFLVRNASAVAKKLKIDLIVADTNYESNEIPGLTVVNFTTYCNVFCALCLQRLFSIYYIASGGPVADFGIKYLDKGFFNVDCSNYDLLCLPAFSTSSLKFVVDGLQWRVDKIKELVDWPIFQHHFDTCVYHNPSKKANGTNDCEKCMHSVNEILSQVGLEGMANYTDVFDVEYIQAHMHEYLAYLIIQRLKRSEVGMDIWRYRSKAGFKWVDYVRAPLTIVTKLGNKFLRKTGVVKRQPTKWVQI